MYVIHKGVSVLLAMSSGGHFKSFWCSRKKRQYFPTINRLGSVNLSPFLTENSLPETDKSKDPLLVSRPASNKTEEIARETDRIVHTRSVNKRN